MDHRRTTQDVVRCNLCETPSPTLHCDICQVHLCKICVGSHLLDMSKEHKVVPFSKRGSTPLCPKHSKNICELYCEQCNSIICAICVSSGEHELHQKIDVLKKIDNMKANLQKDIKELKKSILPKYETIVSNLPAQKAAFEANFQKLKLDVAKKGEKWHKEIDNIVNKLQSDIDEMAAGQKTSLKKQEDEYARLIYEIKGSIVGLTYKISSNDFHCLSAYKSTNAKFRKLPPKLTVSLPSFTTNQINKEQINQQFGFLSALSRKED